MCGAQAQAEVSDTKNYSLFSLDTHETSYHDKNHKVSDFLSSLSALGPQDHHVSADL